MTDDQHWQDPRFADAPELVPGTGPELVPGLAPEVVHSPSDWSQLEKADDGLGGAASPEPTPKPWWKRKLIVIGIILVVLLVIGLAVGLGVSMSKKDQNLDAAPRYVQDNRLAMNHSLIINQVLALMALRMAAPAAIAIATTTARATVTTAPPLPKSKTMEHPTAKRSKVAAAPATRRNRLARVVCAKTSSPSPFTKVFSSSLAAPEATGWP